jgi:Cu2+-exporting ATPase/Cu+-exporting ATPase
MLKAMRPTDVLARIDTTLIQPLCLHCNQRCIHLVSWNEKSFCCHGCLTVYKLLQDQGLQDYYSLRDQSPKDNTCPLPSLEGPQDVFSLDFETFREQYVYGSKKTAVDIYVEGVHCAACLWLLEKIPIYVSGIERARLNMGSQTLTLTGDATHFFAAIEQIRKWGYRPHPLKNVEDRLRFEKRDLRMDLYRIGVAAFCAGNIMLLSVSLYAGVEGPLRRYFELVSLLLSLPVLAYSARPIYINSWRGFRNSRISIDLPILIAVVVTFSVSVWGLLNNGPTYFDSMTALVLLILSSRFFLKRIQQKHLGPSRIAMILNVDMVKKWNGKKYISIRGEDIVAGDQLMIEAGQMIPADGEVISGSGYLNHSLLTGESLPLAVSLPQKVMMGAKLVYGRIEMKASVSFRESRIQKLLKELELVEKPSATLQLADRVGQSFLTVVFVIALSTVVYWWSTDYKEGFYRALAFMIVACPCTFASVLPLVFSLALKKAGRDGVFIKDASVFEKIGRVKKIFFDKTGTLTEGNFEVLQFNWWRPQNPETLNQLFSLVNSSNHPVSQGIARYLYKEYQSVVSDDLLEVEQMPGRGILGKFRHGTVIRIEKMKEAPQSFGYLPNRVEIFINDALTGQISLGDRVRESSANAISELQKSGYKCYMLSGDHGAVVKRTALILGIAEENAFGDLSLDEKAQIVAENGDVMMVGDGNNDALALKKSFIGVAVHGGVETALQSSDVYIANKSFSSLLKFVRLARRTHRLIFISLGISVLYNLVAGTLALLGYIHPLMAAFIMPLNAMTVFVLCLWMFHDGVD